MLLKTRSTMSRKFHPSEDNEQRPKTKREQYFHYWVPSLTRTNQHFSIARKIILYPKDDCSRHSTKHPHQGSRKSTFPDPSIFSIISCSDFMFVPPLFCDQAKNRIPNTLWHRVVGRMTSEAGTCPAYFHNSGEPKPPEKVLYLAGHPT